MATASEGAAAAGAGAVEEDGEGSDVDAILRRWDGGRVATQDVEQDVDLDVEVESTMARYRGL